ncbi:MAG: hydantoinase/oxoprolinase family protein, partial [Planctomycetota bacterium]|nr:hydantoinase/oxoprolinase family protein [Planctomycetota bacterium]
YPVLVPMIDINTIGAGGGSIAHVDAGGALRVGPMSAGSEPGPAAYGKGGMRPTVTDANLVLGRLDKDHFLGGEMRLDEAAAHSAIGRLGYQIGLAEVEAAEGVLTIVNSNMANAIRARTVQKGVDPRGFSLVALGGAGPLHAAEIAAMLDIPEVIVPPYPGITSAAGLLTTDLKYDLIKTEFQVADTIDVDKLNADFAALEKQLLDQYAADSIARDRVRLVRSGDLRYRGQGYELRVGFPDAVLDRPSLAALWEQFHLRHEDEYGHTFRGNPVEIVNIRITGIGEMPKIGRPMLAPGGSLAEAHIRRGQCVFRIDSVLETLDTEYYHRDRMAVGDRIDGPAIVVQLDATTVVPPAWTATVEDCGNLLLRRENRG